jgi:hypothetical protein
MQFLIITSRLKKQNKKSVGYDDWIHSYYYPHTVGYSIWFYVCRPKVAKHKLKQATHWFKENDPSNSSNN